MGVGKGRGVTTLHVHSQQEEEMLSLHDEVTEQRIASVLELVNRVLRGAGSERG